MGEREAMAEHGGEADLRGVGSGQAGASAKVTCSRQSLCVVLDQPVGNPKRKV
jgi:hypothetical protein